MAYEVYQRVAIRVDRPTLSIQRSGKIGLNSAAARLLAAAKVKSIVLLWDAARNKLALKATSKNDRNAYTVSLSPDLRWGSLTAKAFLSHIGWSAGKRETMPATWNETDKMLEVTLRQEYVGVRQQKAHRDNKTKAST
jgi:hypothetical protein